jgi:IclR helix-turn-helix domain
MPEQAITIELSKAQVNRVIREADEDDGLLGRLGGVERLDFQVTTEQLNDPRLSRSLFRGLLVLACFPADGAPRSMKDVAEELDNMGGSTTHRYISTLVEVGLLEQDPASRTYRLAQGG